MSDPTVTTGDPHSDPGVGQARSLTALTWSCVLAFVVALVVLGQTVERTPDERTYQASGRVLLQRQGLHNDVVRFQGPLILLGTQLTDDRTVGVTGDPVLRRARLGMLVFPLLLMLVLVRWSRVALGPRAALLVAFLTATNPTLLALGPLLSSDVAYVATLVLLGFAAFRWLERPGLGRLLQLGAALGANLATKYTAVPTAAVLLAGITLTALLGRGAWPRREGPAPRLLARLAGVAAALAIAVAAALLVLYAAYLFASPPLGADGARQLTAPLLHTVASLPMGATLLGMLPEPMMLGIDYQMRVAGSSVDGTLFDHWGNPWTYYPVTLLVKTPLELLLPALLGAFLLRRRARALWPTALLPALLLLAYVSVTHALQMGVRYVLPMVPAMLLAAGAAAHHPWRWRWLQRALLGLVIAGSLWNVAAWWPRPFGFFNLLAGGATRGYRICPNGNCDWEQRRVTGREELQARHAELTRLHPNQGPRFGRIAAYTPELPRRDPRDPSGRRLYHWLWRFEPIDHDGAAWLVFDITPESFATAVAAGDLRAAEDLALAWLLAGNFAAARAAVHAPPEVAADASFDATRAVIEQMAGADGDPTRREAIGRVLAAQGQFELALTMFGPTRRETAFEVAFLMMQTGRHHEALRFLETRTGDGTRTFVEVSFLAANYCDGGTDFPPDPMHALDLMKQGPAPAPDTPQFADWQRLFARIEAAVQREQRFEAWK